MRTNKKIRAACVKRAAGVCESCGDWVGGGGDLDHYFGRKNSETVETCWLICRPCHDSKTNNRPSATHWAWIYSIHCLKYQYGIEAERAQLRIDVQKAKGLARRDEK